MKKKTIIVTGASGFLGSAICANLDSDSRIIAMDWRKPSDTLLRHAPRTEWHQIDISDSTKVKALFHRIAEIHGTVDFVIHMAAFYHFGRYWLPEYEKTNVKGLRNILVGSLHIGVRRFIFAGSIASLPPPMPGEKLTEKSVSSNYSAYTRSKTIGENMLFQHSRLIPTVTLRIGGVFSDWCELPPLYSLIKLWSKPHLLGRMIPGRGLSGFPYIHRRDLVACVRKTIEQNESLGQYEILFASPSGCTVHKDLYPEIQKAYGRSSLKAPIFVLPWAAKCFLYCKNRLKVLLGRQRYERRWMFDYVDKPLNVDASYTHRLLNWSPSDELGILEQLPRLIRNYQDHRVEWEIRNIRRNEGLYAYWADSM